MVMRFRHSRRRQLSRYIHTRTFRPKNPSTCSMTVTYFNFRHILISPGNFHGIISFRWHFRCRINIINSARQILKKNYIELRWKKEFTLITHALASVVQSSQQAHFTSWVRFSFRISCEKSQSTLCRRSWVFCGCSGFLPKGKLTGLVKINTVKVAPYSFDCTSHNCIKKNHYFIILQSMITKLGQITATISQITKNKKCR